MMKINQLIFTAILFMLGLNLIQAQTTAIPDTTFEKFLIRMNIDSDGLVNGQILNSDATAVTRLDFAYEGVADAKGIEAFINLEELIAYNNNLTSIDLSQNIKLVRVSVHLNSLTSLDLSANVALDIIECGENHNLSTLVLPNNTTLISLSCRYTSISTLDVSSYTDLEVLIMGNTSISSIDVSNNSKLEAFYFNNTLLQSIDLSNNPVLAGVRCEYNSITSLDLSNNTLLAWIECSNSQLTQLNLIGCSALHTLKCSNNNPSLRICVSDIVVAYNNPGWQKSQSAIYSENCTFPKAVEGQVLIDANLNCLVDSSEVAIGDYFLLKFDGGTKVFYEAVNPSGAYVGYLDTGTYTVSVLPPNAYWQACPGTQQLVVSANSSIQNLDFSLQAIVDCSNLSIDIGAPFLRMTGGGSAYSVSYCNTGTIAAANAYVEVDVDPFLEVLQTSLPIVSQTGNIYRFDVGTVAVGECDLFTIQVLVDTSALFEQTHCTEAHIYPDTICAITWAGAVASVEGSCQNDSIYFKVGNAGGTMTQPQQYYVFEDNIIMRSGAVQLMSSADTTITVAAAAGKTYRIHVIQMNGYPRSLGNPIASTVVEGCNPYPDGSFNTGLITLFSNGDGSIYSTVDCQQNIASYDPNDKAAQPAGYGNKHYIYQNIDIDYKIRFQNTGTDTAFNIVIRDAISPFLDISTLKMGASSHPYTWSIESGNVLRVNFDNIMLVDSNANEPLSHGFFRYNIKQQPNNPLETRIENQAAIYFDYNPAIMTNTTFHTVGENFVPIIITEIENILVENVVVKVYPNPFSDQATLEVEGGNYKKLQLKIYDMMGRDVSYGKDAMQSVSTNNHKIQIQRGNLPQGIYIYRLEGDGELINTGKIIIQ